jgi:hypothetical protein
MIHILEDRIEYTNNGRFIHRLDGPAIIYNDGNVLYWIEGMHYTKEEFYNSPDVILYKRNKLIKSILKCS